MKIFGLSTHNNVGPDMLTIGVVIIKGVKSTVSTQPVTTSVIYIWNVGFKIL